MHNNIKDPAASAGAVHTKTQTALCIIFGVLSSLLLTVGRTVYRTNSLHTLWDTAGHLAATAGTFLALSAVSAAAAAVLFSLYEKLTAGESVRPQGGTSHKRLFPFLWILIFISWIPAFLAYFPGITSYDTYPQSRQALAGFSGMNKYHPPLHTMFWALCIRAGAVLGIDATVIYELIQMAALSFAFAVMLYYMIRRHYHPAFVVCSALYIMFNPVIAIFSLEMVKDTALTVFLILLSVRIAELSDAVRKADRVSKGQEDAPSESRPPLSLSFLLSFTVLAVIVCLLRNNAVYAVLLFMPFALILSRGYRLQVFSSLAAALILFGVINGPVYHALGISEGNSREMLSVPIQQITTVVVTRGDDLTEEDCEAIGHFLPCEELEKDYNPRFADYSKNAFNSEYFNSHKKEFVNLWLHLLRRYPEEYFSAFLTLNIQLWYPGSSAVDPYSQREYIETGIYVSEYCSGERACRLPRLLAFYESASKYSRWMGLPVISVLFSLWTPVWLLVICFFALMAAGRPEKTMILYIPFFLWLTYMAGPVSCTRYVFPIMAMYPLIIGTTLHSGTD